ncbi:hypothetical protein F3Y22_tig00110393pilonHSYRG00224 [Hibiscus syriacus]|uniref:Uncharacterized protein n=1 Tax=Hibiscus syriacus TaxID=106335 RepID=A0A6A3ASV1_HIBSY|nr:hypothetical protein F3Y22_tig00110393pilonHSYRG00224 [Hibiscus syriacus]
MNSSNFLYKINLLSNFLHLFFNKFPSPLENHQWLPSDFERLSVQRPVCNRNNLGPCSAAVEDHKTDAVLYKSEQGHKPCDHRMRRSHVGSPTQRHAGKYGPMILISFQREHRCHPPGVTCGVSDSKTRRKVRTNDPHQLPKGTPVPPSAPSKGINNINN